MNYLTSLLENSTMPWFSALVLGLMTAISPCPLATNITAIGYIGRDIDNRQKVFINGLLYTFGRSISYVILALVISFGADRFHFSGIFQRYGEKFIGPLLLLIGFFMLDLIRINFPGQVNFSSVLNKGKKQGYLFSVLLGILFALAFCPYSGVLYFGLLIPMTVSNASGIYLPLIYAVATGIPVIFFAWILAFSIGLTSQLYNKVKIFEQWFRRLIAALFILVGLYYIIRII